MDCIKCKLDNLRKEAKDCNLKVTTTMEDDMVNVWMVPHAISIDFTLRKQSYNKKFRDSYLVFQYDLKDQPIHSCKKGKR